MTPLRGWLPLLLLSSLVEGGSPPSLSPSSSNSSVPDDDLYFGDSEGPRIVRHSHFKQTFRLGYKLLLSCEVEGYPRPTIKWYKNGAEIAPFRTIHIRERHLSPSRLRSVLDIDPTTIADRAIYGCLASNRHGFHLKSIKASYAL